MFLFNSSGISFLGGQNKVRDPKSNNKRAVAEKNISHLKCVAGVRRSTSVDWSRQRFTAQQRLDCTERVMTRMTPMGCHSTLRLCVCFLQSTCQHYFLGDSWLQRWFLCSCVGAGEIFNCCFNQYIHFTLFIVCDLSSLQRSMTSRCTPIGKKNTSSVDFLVDFRGFPWFNDFLSKYSCW